MKIPSEKRSLLAEIAIPLPVWQAVLQKRFMEKCLKRLNNKHWTSWEKDCGILLRVFVCGIVEI
jgi:hypothetical protein